jgi:FlgD Ig-like domain
VRRSVVSTLTLVLCLLSFACPAGAQTLGWDALGTTGGRSSSATMGLGFTSGQAVTGTSLQTSLIETVGFWHPLVPGTVSVGPETLEQITPFRISDIVPNPSSTAATIHFTVPLDLAAFGVSIEVVDLSGRIVRTLFAERHGPGVHTIRWDGRSGDGLPASSGIYFCRLEAGGHRSVRRLALVR